MFLAYKLWGKALLDGVLLSTKNWRLDGWMNGVLGHFYALSRLNWAGDNLG